MGEALLAVLPGKGWNREPGDPLIRFPVLFRVVFESMDNVLVDHELQAYRDDTGDTRSWA
jgi:hypothetical protein